MSIPERRLCPRCHQDLPAAAFYLRHGKLSSWCKDCARKVGREVHARIRARPKIAPQKKRCSACHQMRPGQDFTGNSSHLDGLSNECRPCASLSAKRTVRLLKKQVIGHYGGVCACCGETTIEFLCIDHVNGGGARHREKLGMNGGVQFYRWLRRNHFPTGYRVLCSNCNLSLGAYGYCPHKRSR